MGFRDHEWIVVTYDGLFLRADGVLSEEYPNAATFSRESFARRAAEKIADIGPYNVVTTEAYASGLWELS